MAIYSSLISVSPYFIVRGRRNLNSRFPSTIESQTFSVSSLREQELEGNFLVGEGQRHSSSEAFIRFFSFIKASSQTSASHLLLPSWDKYVVNWQRQVPSQRPILGGRTGFKSGLSRLSKSILKFQTKACLQLGYLNFKGVWVWRATGTWLSLVYDQIMLYFFETQPTSV